MKPFHFLAVVALMLTVSCNAVEQTSIQNETPAPSRKAIVEESFQQWQDGTGSPFDPTGQG